VLLRGVRIRRCCGASADVGIDVMQAYALVTDLAPSGESELSRTARTSLYSTVRRRVATSG
jgi:hypothetical protein